MKNKPIRLLGFARVIRRTTLLIAILFGVPTHSNSQSYSQKGYSYDSTTLAPYEIVEEIAKDITVKISGAGSSGSGVLIKKQGNTYTVATAWHVISNDGLNEQIDIYTSDGARHTTYGRNARQFPDVDAGTITFQSKKQYKVAKIMPDLSRLNRNLDSSNTEGEPLGVAGFPQDKRQFKYSTGILVAYAHTGIGSGYELLYTNKTSSGMSGGPILNRSGLLIGIHGRGDRDQVAIVKRGLSENTKTAVNQGIPLNYIYSGIRPEPIGSDEPTEFLKTIRRASRYWGREQISLKMIDNLISNYPTSGAFLARGKIYSDLGEADKAINDFRKSINIDPLNFQAMYSLGSSLYENGELDQSWKLLMKLLESDPPLELVQPSAVLAANIKTDQGEYAYSIKFAEHAIRLDPNSTTGYLSLGRAYEKQNQLGKALQAYNRYSGALSAKLSEAKSKIYFAKSEYAKAWDEINGAIAMHEMFGDKASNTRLEKPSSAYAFRAVLQAMQGLCSRSKADIKKAESLNRLNPFVKDSSKMANRLCL